jgi:inner membrane protein
VASAFAHIAIPVVLYVASKNRLVSLRLFFLAALVSILPDVDVLAFTFGIAYESPWGHRGFTHSLIFALALSVVMIAFHGTLRSSRRVVFWVSFVSCISHALLDALTNGGLGVALFWPFSQERFFFPFRPIEVSPIGISNFFTARGAKVIISELQWIILPATLIVVLATLTRMASARALKPKSARSKTER